ncbi:MAG: phage holin family protein [Hydrogenophaga sp.]|nr:phage holin family protein [Hydrogenophaga sp.]
MTASLKTLAGTVLELLQLRLELLSVEAQEEVQRLGGLLVYGAVAVTFLSLGLGFLAILITVALWDSHRLLALAVFATLFLSLGGVCAWLARARALAGTRFFSSSAAELKRDRESLRS